MTSLEDAVASLGNPTGLPSTAIVNAVNLDGTVDLYYLAAVAASVPVLAAGYVPQAGDVVQILRRGPGSLVVIGQLRASNPASARVRSDLALLWAVNGVPVADAGGASSGTYTYRPSSSGSYRSGTGWDTDFVAQGAYVTRWGYYQGEWFYGSGAFNNLRGRTITRVRISLQRMTGSGVFAAEPISIYTTKNATRPGGAPFYVRKVATPRLAVGASGVFDLPNSVGADLAAGRALGLGIRDNSTANYLRLSGRSDFNDSGLLTISWTE